MLDGKRKYEYDGYIFILQTLNVAIWNPKVIGGNINPYSTDTIVELSEEQAAAKREMDMKAGMKLFAKYLCQFKRPKREKV